jgi:hypothetical protein
VYRDNDLVGNTPYTLQKPKDAERVELELRLSGYANRAFAITSATRAELNLTLTPDKQSSRRPAASRRPEPQATPEKSARPKPDKPRRGVDTEVLDPWD